MTNPDKLADALRVADDIERLRGESGDCGEPFYVTTARAQTWINTLRALAEHDAQPAPVAESAGEWVMVPKALPFDVLGEAGIAGVFETGNPKHGWDFLLAKVGKPLRPLSNDYIEQHIGPDEDCREAVVEVVREVERAHGIAPSHPAQPAASALDKVHDQTLADLGYATAPPPAAQSGGELSPQSLVCSLAESARCLGVAQAKGDAHAIAHWDAETNRYETAAIAALRQQSPANRTAMPEGDMHRALDWVRQFPGNAMFLIGLDEWRSHVAALEEAVAAYDPARVGADTVCRPAMPEGVAVERERCARLCEWLPIGTGLRGKTFAEAIRGTGMGGELAKGFEDLAAYDPAKAVGK